MARGFCIFIAILFVVSGTNAASVRGVSNASRTGKTTAAVQTANPTSSYTYNYMYPYLNNQMRTTLKPADATSPSTSPINAVVRTEQLSAPRRVVARSAKKTSGIAAPVTDARRVVARSAVKNSNNNQRAVVSRTKTITNSNDSSRLDMTNQYRSSTNAASIPDTPTISSARCLADYTECMDRYCARENMKYNRCYCSAKLSQIDATYQPEIDSLVKQIIAIKSGGDSVSDAEFNEYWMEKIGQYPGDNSWEKIDDFLNIDWASMESRVRGQNAFITGHDYCVQHLRGCFYMASNLRDAYRSTINTDCATYEVSLQKLKNAAESVIKAYQE